VLVRRADFEPIAALLQTQLVRPGRPRLRLAGQRGGVGGVARGAGERES